MALQNALGDIALDATVQSTNDKLTEIEILSQQIADLTNSVNTLVQFLYANSPRLDVANRVVTNGSEIAQAVSGTVTATVANATIASGNLTTLSGQPVQYSGQDVPLHIYENIKVT